jgi:hypothetical protein
MKVFPRHKAKEEKDEPELSKIQILTRIAALILAFISVFFFFFKILFF